MKKDRTDNDTLREQYEDALFKLLMDEFSEKEGQLLTAENNRLKSDEDFVVPDGLEARCEKTISNIFTAKKRKKSLQNAKKVLSRVAVVVLVTGLVFGTLFSSVSAFREAIYKVLVNDESVNTDIGFKESNVTSGFGNPIDVPSGEYLPSWLPEGYILISYEKDEFQSIATFGNDSGNKIYFYEVNNGPVLGVDTEEADSMEKISINGYDGLVVVKGAKISITWVDDKRNIFARIKTLDIDKKTLIKIAESVNEY